MTYSSEKITHDLKSHEMYDSFVEGLLSGLEIVILIIFNGLEECLRGHEMNLCSETGIDI